MGANAAVSLSHPGPASAFGSVAKKCELVICCSGAAK
jgi:hypothetical protein